MSNLDLLKLHELDGLALLQAMGRKIATAEAKLFTADGELAAHGTSTLMIIENARWSSLH